MSCQLQKSFPHINACCVFRYLIWSISLMGDVFWKKKKRRRSTWISFPYVYILNCRNPFDDLTTFSLRHPFDSIEIFVGLCFPYRFNSNLNCMNFNILCDGKFRNWEINVNLVAWSKRKVVPLWFKSKNLLYQVLFFRNIVVKPFFWSHKHLHVIWLQKKKHFFGCIQFNNICLKTNTNLFSSFWPQYKRVTHIGPNIKFK